MQLSGRREAPEGIIKRSHIKQFTHCGGNSLEVPPVPIPNTEVKLQYVEDTWLVTARKNRSLPHFIFLSSSMAEHSAVNRRVVGSSPTWGAKNLYPNPIFQMEVRFGFFLTF